MIFRGTYTALVTPFRDLELDIEALELLIYRQLEHHIDGLVLIGTTAESPTLTPIEERTIIETAQRVVKGRIPLIVGVGTNSTAKTVEKSLIAQDLGADALLIISPYYNCPTQEGLYQHFTTIADRVDIPIILYNHPKRTGTDIEVETLLRISRHPNIVGIKEVCSDVDRLKTILGHRKEGFSVVTGDDAMASKLIELGGDGVISVASNLVPGLMQNISQHEKLQELFKALCIETNPIPIKTALSFMGLIEEEFRLPLTPMDKQNKEILLKELKNLNLNTQNVYSRA